MTFPSTWQGMFVSDTTTTSFLMSGMAEDGMLPAVFARRFPPHFDSPVLPIAISFTIVNLLLFLPFSSILQADNFLYSLQVIRLESKPAMRGATISSLAHLMPQDETFMQNLLAIHAICLIAWARQAAEVHDYSLQLLAEIASLIKLRIDQPDLARPFKVNLSTPWLAGMMAFPAIFVMYQLCTRCGTAPTCPFPHERCNL